MRPDRAGREPLEQLARIVAGDLGLALESGAVPFMILGQLAWFVRDKLANLDPRRVPTAVDALFRTDLDMKSSGGDPRILLERLVVELSAGVGTADASGGGWQRR